METAEARLKRMRMRSWRRGTKEMDMILGPFSDTQLTTLNDAQLTAYDAMLEENDQELYAWVTGHQPTPVAHVKILDLVKNHINSNN